MHRFVPRHLLMACLTVACATAAPVSDPPQSRPRTDRYGDPLPAGALARLGCSRLRHAGLADFVFLDGGQTILSASGDPRWRFRATAADGLLRFWDAATGRQVRAVRLQGTTGSRLCVALSPDGRTVAAHDRAGQRILLWETASGKRVQELPVPNREEVRHDWNDDIAFLRFSPDGKILAIGSWFPITFWEWETRKERPLTDSTSWCGDDTYHGHFSPDGRWFAGGGGCDKPLCVFEVATGRVAHRWLCRAQASAFAPDGKRLAVSCMRDYPKEPADLVRLFDLADGKEAAQFALPPRESAHALAFSPDGQTLACCVADLVLLLDSTTGRPHHQLTGSVGRPTFAPDGQTLAAGFRSGLRLWDPATGKERHDPPAAFGPESVLAIAPDGRRVASTHWDNHPVRLWETASGRPAGSFPVPKKRRDLQALTFTRNGQTLIAANGNGDLYYWDAATGQMQRTVELWFFPYSCSQLHVSSDGRQVAALSPHERRSRGTLTLGGGEVLSSRLSFWGADRGESLSEPPDLPHDVRAGAWSDDGRTLAVPLKDGLTVLKVPLGTSRFQIAGTPRNGAFRLSPDGRLLAAWRPTRSPAEPAAVGIWETATGNKVITQVTDRADHVAFTPDNRRLVATDEGSLRVWDLATGQERRRYSLPVAVTDADGNTFVTHLLAFPDSKRALTALADGTGLIWDLGPAPEPPAKSAGPQQIAAWWADLGGADATRGRAAVEGLAAAPAAALPFLRAHLQPAAGPDAALVRRRIAELDSDSYAMRQTAFQQLDDWGEATLPTVRRALENDPSPEARPRLKELLHRSRVVREPQALRRLRAVEVLERIASPEATRLLTALARGAHDAPETQDARAALDRLTARAPKP